MKTHPNRKRVLRKIASAMRWHYFGDYWLPYKSAKNLKRQCLCIYSYIREDANGRYF